jgi:uncharacterized protein involved in exopolysaccharide biosynthesis
MTKRYSDNANIASIIMRIGFLSLLAGVGFAIIRYLIDMFRRRLQ